jgi:hypothetical protein
MLPRSWVASYNAGCQGIWLDHGDTGDVGTLVKLIDREVLAPPQIPVAGSLLLVSSQMIWSQESTKHQPVTLKREYRDGETLAYRRKRE